jgi:hypothetical protein
MLYPIEKIRLISEAGVAWMQAAESALARSSSRLSIPMEEAAEAASWSAEVTADGKLHLALQAPGGEWAKADVPWAHWSVAGDLQ